MRSRWVLVASGGLVAWLLAGCAALSGPAKLAEPNKMPTTTPRLRPDGTQGARIAVGANHACAVLDSGAVLCWGSNESGQLGWAKPDQEPHAKPKAIPGIADAVEVVAGNGFSCTRHKAGSVTCWGAAPLPGSCQTRRCAQTVPDVAGAVQLSAGPRHVCALQNSGVVSCWGESGSNSSDNRRPDVQPPVRVQGVARAVQISCGGDIVDGSHHCCALRDDGHVACWGDNAAGQLGNGSLIDHHEAVEVAGLDDAVHVAVGGQRSCAVRATGAVWCWGYASESAREHDAQDFAMYATGGDVERTLRWRATHGWTRVPLAHGRQVPNAGSPEETTEQESTETTTESAQPTPKPIDAMREVNQVTVSNHALCARKREGSLQCQGFNALVRGASMTSKVAELAMSPTGNHACSLDETGAVTCWGMSDRGQSGRLVKDVVWPPEAVPEVKTALHVSASASRSCAVLRDGRLSCWGVLYERSNPQGIPEETGEMVAPGMGGWTSAGPTLVPRVVDVLQVGVRNNYGCAVRRGGDVACWGANDDVSRPPMLASVGDAGIRMARPVVDAVRVVAGSAATCAVLRSGGVECWSADGWTRRFPDAIDVTLEPEQAEDPCIVRASGKVVCWDQAGFVDNKNPGQVIAKVDNVARVTGFGTRLCGLKRDGSITCWSPLNRELVSDQAPRGNDFIDLAAWAGGICAVTRAGEVRCRGARPNELNERDNIGFLPEYVVPAVEGVVQLSSGGQHLCATLQSGRVACWGDNHYGQTGVGVMMDSRPTLVARLR